MLNVNVKVKLLDTMNHQNLYENKLMRKFSIKQWQNICLWYIGPAYQYIALHLHCNTCLKLIISSIRTFALFSFWVEA